VRSSLVYWLIYFTKAALGAIRGKINQFITVLTSQVMFFVQGQDVKKKPGFDFLLYLVQ